jgi:hypothetical protein
MTLVHKAVTLDCADATVVGTFWSVVPGLMSRTWTASCPASRRSTARKRGLRSPCPVDQRHLRRLAWDHRHGAARDTR